MRFALTLLPLLLLACDPAAPTDVDDAPIVDEPALEPEHPCRVALQDALDAGGGWDPAQLQSCYDGCDLGAENGFDQGRLTCITEAEYCPDCQHARGDTPFDLGFTACYPEGYDEGYQEEGCVLPPI